MHTITLQSTLDTVPMPHSVPRHEAPAVRIEDLLLPMAERIAQLQTLQEQMQRELSATVRRLAQQQDREHACEHLAQASRFSPKDRRVAFIGRSHFGDNIKYAWLATQQRAAALDLECWFLPFDDAQEQLMKSLGMRCFPHHPLHWTREHVGLALRTAVAVTCDHFTSGSLPNPYATALFAGARLVQLWHGISIKEIALRNPVALPQMTGGMAELLSSCGHFASFVGASAGAESEWRRWFSFENYAATGYPRNDVLLREPGELDLINVDPDAMAAARHTRATGGRVVLYVPTFRDQMRGRWILNIGLEQLAAALHARGDLLLVNLHPYEAEMVAQLRPRYPQAQFVAGGTDIYPLLRESDALVTDYSSLMFDYLLLDRPVFFWRPDHERYLAQSRALFDDKIATPPGPMAHAVEDLVALLQGDFAVAAAEHATARHDLRARLFDAQGDAAGRAGERVAELVAAEVARAVAA